MAATETSDTDLPAPPDVAPWLARAAAPWLASPRTNLAAMLKNGRLPHALMMLGAPGAGQTEVALWIAARLLCDHRGADPCGACGGCRLFAAGTHPDFQWIRVAEDAKDISIQQIRALLETLSLKSYRGGGKAAVIDPADAMNIHSFNALLKTLEEPADNTWLMLTVSRNDRVPRTIASRMAKFRLPLPAAADALAWLAQQETRERWDSLLALAHGAPFLALQHAAAGLEHLDREMHELLAAAGQGRMDLVATAKAWAENEPAARLFWLENWLSGQLREAGLARDLTGDNRLPWLRAAARETRIQAGFRLLDGLRDARRLVGGALNTQLLIEGLLVSLAPVAAGGAAEVQESVE